MAQCADTRRARSTVSDHTIPRVDLSALFGGDETARAQVDRAVHLAARTAGMLVFLSTIS